MNIGFKEIDDEENRSNSPKNSLHCICNVIIVYMQKKQAAINDGSYQLPKPGKTQIYRK